MSSQTANSGIGIHRILMATDLSVESSRALQHALAVARHYGADLDLVHAIQPHTYNLAGPDIMAQAHTQAEREIGDLTALLRRTGALDGVNIRSWVLDGEVAEVACRIVRSQKTDLVVIATHGRSGLRKLVLGSVAEEVYRHSPCPVLTVGPYSPGMRRNPSLARVLVATDLSPASSEALPWAVAAAQEFGARLTVLDVCLNLEAKGEAAHGREHRIAELQGLLRELANGSSGPVPDSHFEIAAGTTAKDILEFAAAQKADLIVQGLTPAYTFSDRAPWSNAYRIVCEASCPVLTVRAEG
jgi:nucleotide-binding universal stress UspA family protein